MSERLRLAEYYVGHHCDTAVGAIQQMPADAASQLIEAIEDSLSILILKTMLPTAAARCLEAMSVSSAAKYLTRLNAKDAAAILRYSSDASRQALLGKFSRRHALRISILLRYPKTLVGAWMDSVMVSLQPDTGIADAKAQVMEGKYDYRDIYVVNRHNEVVGAVSVIDLLQHKDTDQTVAKIMNPVNSPIVASLTLEQGIDWEAWMEFDTLPVVDHESKFVGIVRFVDLWGALVDSPTVERLNESNDNIFGIVEIYCNRLADLMAATLAARPTRT